MVLHRHSAVVQFYISDTCFAPSPLTPLSNMTVAFTAKQIDATLTRLAASSAKTAEERSNVNFGEGEQPQSRVLNQWLRVGFPADAMLAMHRCGFGKAETIGIYLGAKGDPEPESFLLACAK